MMRAQLFKTNTVAGQSTLIAFEQAVGIFHSRRSPIGALPDACQPEAHPFLDPLWFGSWGGQFLSPGQPVLCSPCDCRLPAGFVPLYVDDLLVKSVRFRVLQVVGAPNAGWLDVSNGGAGEAAYHAFSAAILGAVEHWDIALLHRIRGQRRAEAIIESARRAGMSGRCYPSARLIGTNSYGSGAEYLASRQKSFLGGTRRHYRRMQEDGEVCIHLFGAGFPQPCTAALGWIDKIVANSWQGRDQSSVFSPGNGKVRDFHLKLIGSTQHYSYAPTVAILTLDQVPVAYQYGFQSASHYTNYAREYDERYGARSPGGVLNLLYMPTLFDTGVRTVDFGIGDARDKRKWGDWTETVYSVYLFHGAWRSRMFRLFQDIRRTAKRAYFSVAGKDPFQSNE